MIDGEIQPVILVVVALLAETIVVVSSTRDVVDPFNCPVDVLVEVIIKITSVDLGLLTERVVEIQPTGVVREHTILTSPEVHWYATRIITIDLDLHGSASTHE